MKTLIPLLIIAVLAMGALEGDTPDVRRDMAAFDRAFIPLWLYVRDGNITRAKAAVFFLEFQWQKLRGKYQEALPEEEWQGAFDRVNGWLNDTYYAVDANAPKLAFNQLEHVRYDLQQLRRLYRIDYFPDHLFNYYDEVTMLSETANDEMLCMMEWPDFEEMTVAALQHWRMLMKRPFNADLYGLDVEEERLFRQYQVEMEQALEVFLTVVETADREAIAAESTRLEDAFLPVLRLFGNFEASRTYYASR